MRTTRACFGFPMAALILALALSGCGGETTTSVPVASITPSEETLPTSSVNPSDSTAGQTPDAGDWIIENIGAQPAHLNVLLATPDANAAYLVSFIFETLLDIDMDTMEMIPRIAKSWEISDDHLTYTFHLREDVTFSDGVPLTSNDIAFTHELIDNPENDTVVARSYLQDIEQIEVIDDYTIRYTMNKPYFRHLIVLGLLEIYPKHIYEGADFNNHPNNRNPIGSGPYVFEKWDTGQEIVLARNENYWGEKPPIDKRVFKIITNPNAALQALENHSLDTLEFDSPELWVRRASRPEFEAEFNKFIPDSPIPGPLSRYNFIGWNMRKPQFSDKRVRQALVMLFDRQLVIDEIWAGLGTLITGSVFHKSPEYNHAVEPWPFDPQRAMALLDEAGWIDRDRDGVREKDGVRLEFELSFGANVPEYDQLGTVYQEELQRAGIRMTLSPVEWATFQERVHKRTFDACMLAWLTAIAPDPYQLWHSSQAENGSNYPGFKNDEVDRILDEGRMEFDQAKRIQMYHRFHEILHEEQPYAFLYARPGLVAVDKRFHGIKQYNAGLDPLEWWVPSRLQKYQ